MRVLDNAHNQAVTKHFAYAASQEGMLNPKAGILQNLADEGCRRVY